MMRLGTIGTQRSLLLFGVIAFFFAGFLATAHADMGMYDPMPMLSDVTPTAPMQGCLLSGVLHTNTPCRMNPLEHIAGWQNMLSALPAQKSFFLFLALFFFALALYAAGKIFGVPRTQSAHRAVFRGRFFDHATFARPLQEAFSNGILHPKIF